MYENEKKINKLFFYWLIASLFMVFLIIIVGGLTRLTDSGLSITKWELFKGILPPLTEAAWEQYFEKYKILSNFKLDMGAFNIQKYEKGGHFKGVHSERMGVFNMDRVFAWMTYLNDVEEGGHTYFPTQQAKIKPVKGLTLLWPADWTHLHQGIVAPNETKMIVTGWYDYVGTTDTRTLLQQETSAE